MSGGERVRLAEEGGADDLLARRRSEPDEVTEDRRAVERSGIACADVRVAAHPDAGREAVRPRPRGQRELDDPPVLEHPRFGVGRERDAFPSARDPDDIVEREGASGELDGHAGTLRVRCAHSGACVSPDLGCRVNG